MFSEILWAQIVAIFFFNLYEFILKYTITKEAKIIFAKQVKTEDISSNPLYQKLYNEIIDSQEYFINNAGIFLLPIHPGLLILATFHSILLLLTAISAILSVFFTSFLQALCFSAIFIFMMFLSPMPSWYPLANNTEENFRRSLHNHCKGEITSSTAFNYKPLFSNYQRIVAEYINGDSPHGRKENSNTNIHPFENDSMDISIEYEDNENSIMNTLNRVVQATDYVPNDEDSLVFQFYLKILEDRDPEFELNGFYISCFDYIIFEMKSNDSSKLYDFNKTNRFFDFNKYNAYQDELYYECNNYDEIDEDQGYMWIIPENADVQLQIEIEDQDKGEALIDRIFLRKDILIYIEACEEIQNLQISNLEKTMMNNKDILQQTSIKRHIREERIKWNRLFYENRFLSYVDSMLKSSSHVD